LVEFLVDIDKFYNVDGEGFVLCNGKWVVILLVALDVNESSFIYGCDFFGQYRNFHWIPKDVARLLKYIFMFGPLLI